MEVLDTSAFIHEYTTDDTVVSVPEVHEEAHRRGSAPLRRDGGLRHDDPRPGPEVLDNVRRAARGSGDAAELSDTDTRLIATALELSATLVTDDYAMQNVAERLDISVKRLHATGSRRSANGGSSASAATGPSTRTKSGVRSAEAT